MDLCLLWFEPALGSFDTWLAKMWGKIFIAHIWPNVAMKMNNSHLNKMDIPWFSIMTEKGVVIFDYLL